MSQNLKANIIYFGSFFVIFICAKLVLTNLFKIESGFITGFIAVVIASVFSPRKQVVQKQSGEEIQFKWIFSKRVFVVK
ncbi:hypothetical protein [Winogradskyella immobilis]|uniref:Uncharacterized protein n=1 Tax=Winogradskyella immobilis TaxID=2816852 RepID=A0ABS8EKS6_9FLAO|nr:hypothetical protein [Winogradskyella immobilis]MCC1483442.1 hypothetical protein [Winogradskyella immobilis]MCG0015536.1 hypothetical protein [Winogradskyella immobilis]